MKSTKLRHLRETQDRKEGKSSLRSGVKVKLRFGENHSPGAGHSTLKLLIFHCRDGQLNFTLIVAADVERVTDLQWYVFR